jgi:indole-3-glycerol phosphate synthase
VGTKRVELEALKPHGAALFERAAAAPPARDFGAALRRDGEVAVISEVKRRSPGAGEIRPGLDPSELARDYEAGGAAALSVLTDRSYFGGSLEDLAAARSAVTLPALRKDFVIDGLQITEARAAGADAVLLIARILSDDALRALLESASSHGLSALVEVHDAEELDRACAVGATLIGINNRDLATFRTDLRVTIDLLDRVPSGATIVSESGIRTRADVERLGREGVHAVLVGESLLRESDPGQAVRALSRAPRRERARV